MHHFVCGQPVPSDLAASFVMTKALHFELSSVEALTSTGGAAFEDKDLSASRDYFKPVPQN